MKRHRFDAFALIMGLTIIGMGTAFLLGPQDGEMNLRWFLPTLAVSVGLALLAAAFQRLRSR